MTDILKETTPKKRPVRIRDAATPAAPEGSAAQAAPTPVGGLTQDTAQAAPTLKLGLSHDTAEPDPALERGRPKDTAQPTPTLELGLSHDTAQTAPDLKAGSREDAAETASDLEPGRGSAATAALALAVMSAEKAAPRSPGTSKAPGPLNARKGAEPIARAEAPKRAGRAGSRLTARGFAAAAALLLALGGGWMATRAVTAQPQGDPRWTEAAAALRQGQEDVLRLTGDVKALRVTVEALKESLERSRTEGLARQAQLIERLDRTERAPQDVAAKVEQIAFQLDRIEIIANDPAVKLASLGERLDRIERQIGAAAAAKPVQAAVPATAVAAVPPAPPVPAPMPEAPTQTSSIDKAKDQPLDGWVLHEVYDGVALIESRNRRLVEVGLGEMVPGVGRVEAIERRGKRWVVVTAKGVITAVR